MTNQYLLLYHNSSSDQFGFEEGKSHTKMEFLKNVDTSVLKEHEWAVYKIEESNHKDDFIRDGLIEEIYTE
jgi:hypothetical protein